MLDALSVPYLEHGIVKRRLEKMIRQDRTQKRKAIKMKKCFLNWTHTLNVCLTGLSLELFGGSGRCELSSPGIERFMAEFTSIDTQAGQSV